MSEDMRGFWEWKHDGGRRFVVGLSHDGSRVHYHNKYGVDICLSLSAFLYDYTRLPPECDSFDWVPPPRKVWRDATAADFPKYWGAECRVRYNEDTAWDEQYKRTWVGYVGSSMFPFMTEIPEKSGGPCGWRFMQILVEPGQ